jgi:hypothetical protein
MQQAIEKGSARGVLRRRYGAALLFHGVTARETRIPEQRLSGTGPGCPGMDN